MKLGLRLESGLGLGEGCLHALPAFQNVQHRLAQVSFGDEIEVMIYWCRPLNRRQAGVVSPISELVHKGLADLV